jgi:hypothetical protein
MSDIGLEVCFCLDVSVEFFQISGLRACSDTVSNNHFILDYTILYTGLETPNSESYLVPADTSVIATS